MPFNGSGTFSIINTFVPNTTILSSAVNANFTDIASGLSDCLTRDGQAGMTAILKAIAGSAGAPSITFTADPTSGLYLVNVGSLGLTSNGIVALTLDASQVAEFSQSAYAKTFVVLDTADATTSSNITSLSTAGTGAITVGTSTNWNTNGYLLAGAEIMSYTIASATSLTINTRGDMGTTGASHVTGATVTMLYSGISKADLLLPARATASRPAAPAPGDFGFNTGSSQPEYYNGSAWVSSAPPAIVPQGYLSPTAGTPIITGDATSQATIYYNPYQGNVLPVPTAGVFSLQTFSTAAITLSASQAVNGIYDVYAFVSGGALTFGIGPSWSAGTSGSVTPGSCARGTSTGGAALSRVGGFNVNATTMSLLNGVTSYSIATASGIYLGSLFINPATAGTVNLHRGYGQNRQWGIWNCFNRTPIYLKEGDSTASWTYTTAAYRPSNNSTANSIVIFSGLAEEECNTLFTQRVVNAGGNLVVNSAIGFNATNAASGFASQLALANTNVQQTSSPSNYVIPPFLGINIITALEQSAASGTTTWYGTEANMLLTASYRG